MFKTIKNIYNVMIEFFKKAIIWFWYQFINTDFLVNHLITLFFLSALYFWKEYFYNSYLKQWIFSLSSINFIYYSLFYFIIFMLLYSGYLIYYVYYIKDKEKTSKKAWYIKFLEDEYKTTYEPFIKWLWFFITILISSVAIYMTLISMQFSLDVANGTLNWKIDLKGTFTMFKQLWTGLAVIISTFTICYIYYRFSVIKKNSYVKEKYYSLYLKKSNQNSFLKDKN